MSSRTPTDLATLAELVTRLRAPDGCPWDREQTLPDLRTYLLEEAHEAAAAIDSGDLEELRAELGDLQFQIVFLSHLAAETGAFDLGDVLRDIHTKMVDRHPHVFGDATEQLADAGAVREAWERRKARRKRADSSLLDGVKDSLPALAAAYRLTQKAAGVGFDWPNEAAVLAKLDEELGELVRAMRDADSAASPDAGDRPASPPPASGAGREAARAALREELGDVLFAVVNLARHLEVDPEAALAAANRKFRRRFHHVEAGLAEAGVPLADATLEAMDALWEEAKARESR